MKVKFFLLGIILVVMLVASPERAQAGATFIVNSTGDGGDSNPGDLVCDDGTGSCTLRAAIEETNAIIGPDTIEFKIPDTDAGCHPVSKVCTIKPLIQLTAINDSLTINGYPQFFAEMATDTDPAALKIELDGSLAGDVVNGLRISAQNTTIKGLVINRFANSNCTTPKGYGIIISGGTGVSDTIIQGNYIGTDATGTEDLGNSCGGLIAFSASGTIIGGIAVAERNVISGNGEVGISISGGVGENFVIGNYIGTDVTGKKALGNGVGGVFFGTTDSRIGLTSDTTPGGPCTGACNIISGNGEYGVSLGAAGATHNIVVGNYIGTDVTGAITDPDSIPGNGDELGNGQYGVEITQSGGGFSSENTIGGTTPEARNVISGNGVGGVFVLSSLNTVMGNFIGTDATGTAPLGNGHACPDPGGAGCYGVFVQGDSNDIGGGVGTTPGGACAGTCNLISGNFGSGVGIQNADGFIAANGKFNKIHGNLIGTQLDGFKPLGNALHGVHISFGAKNNFVGGGSTVAFANTIAFNGFDGVAVDDSSPPHAGAGLAVSNLIQGNSIFSNGGLGINLTNDFPADGVTLNDPGGGDGDDGANDLQNYPVLTVAAASIIQGTLNSKANTFYQIEFYSNDECDDPSGHGEGKNLLGLVGADTGDNLDGSGDVSFKIDLLAPLPPGKFVTATASEPGFNNTSEFSACAQAGVITVNSTNDPGMVPECTPEECTLHEAIRLANLSAGLDTIKFAIPDTDDNNCDAGVCTIFLNAAPELPSITDTVIIDGYTQGQGQDAAMENDQLIDQGSSAMLKIVLDGTDVDPMTGAILRIEADNSEIRGLVISNAGIDNTGILVLGNGIKIQGNFIGTDVTGTSAAGNFLGGVTITGGSDNLIGGPLPKHRNVISGNQPKANGVSIVGAGPDNKVQGNFIGTQKDGDTPLANSGDGIQIFDTMNSIIGGIDPQERNVISANAGSGVLISGAVADGNRIRGNLIGTDLSGLLDRGNTLDGVRITGAPLNTVGGDVPGAGNVISANGGYGVSISGAGADGNDVLGNIIGAKSNGTDPLGNVLDGVSISGSPNNTVGGASMDARNVISGNLGAGVSISGAGSMGNDVLGNFIGTASNGAGALGNGLDGVSITGASNNTVGGAMFGMDNVISLNQGAGVSISGAGATGNDLRRNRIGTDVTGLIPRGNLGPGVSITQAAAGNLIGDTDVTSGLCDGSCNTIAFNGGEGVFVESGSGTRILGNSIFTNGGLGIDLAPQGVTDNDVDPPPPDDDAGPNNLQNFPILTSVTSSGVGGILISTPNMAFRVEAFANATCDDPSNTGEGRVFLGFTGVMTADDNALVPGFVAFAITVPVPGNLPVVTLTATDGSGNTSEFSPCMNLGTIVVNSTGNQVDGSAALNVDDDGVCDTGNAADGFTGLCTLRAAIMQANADTMIVNTIEFAIPDDPLNPCPPHTIGPPLETISFPVTIDGYTQPGSFKNMLTNGTNAKLCIQVSGAQLRIDTAGGGSTIEGLVINKVNGAAIFVDSSDGNTIKGNFIGTDVAGITTDPDGMFDSGDETANTVGVTLGVSISGQLGSSGNAIGGTTPPERNLISGNQDGVVIISGSNMNTVQGNLIGTNSAGTEALPNTSEGVIINGSPTNTIGGDTANLRNVISGNGTYGVHILGTGSTNNMVQGNFIGTDAFGVLPLPNGANGVRIASPASGNTIGGPGMVPGSCSAPCNIIAFNGTIPNSLHGVEVSGANATGNRFMGNSIHSNSGLGINLFGGVQFAGKGEVTENDLGDADTGLGPNNLQNYPVLGTATTGSTIIPVTLNSTAITQFAVEFFSNDECDSPSGHGEGQTFLGSASASTNANGDDIFFVTLTDLPAGQPYITATATNPANDTSEFSKCVGIGLDADADGIIDDVDTEPANDANDAFSDLGVPGGTTAGTIDRGDRDWRVQDTVLVNEGVKIIVGPGAQDATVQGSGSCNPTLVVGGVTVNMDTSISIGPDGGAFVLSCGSTSVQVEAGLLTTIATVDGVTASVVVGAGGGVIFDLTDTGELQVTNTGTIPLLADINGTPIDLAPAESITPTLATAPVATPTPEATATPEPPPTVVAAPTPTPSPVPTATPSPVPTATPSPVPTATPSPVPTATLTPVPTVTPSPMPPTAPTAAFTATPVSTPAPPTAIPTLTAAPLSTATPLAEAARTASPAPTASLAPTLTAVPVATATPVAEAAPAATAPAETPAGGACSMPTGGGPVPLDLGLLLLVGIPLFRRWTRPSP